MVDLDGQLRVHPDVKISTALFGREQSPVLLIDNFLADPEVLKTYAAERCTFEGVSDTFYPGIRAPIPPIYSFAIRAFLGTAIGKTFGLDPTGVTRELSHFSLITTPPGQLNPPQRMPHIDSPDPKQLAILHYLCGPDLGGTSFYRHRRTGFETIDRTKRTAYLDGIKEDLAAFGPPSLAYICRDDPRYERIATIPAAFNRVLIYRSMNLHSADIAPEFNFDPDPRTGRLTANTFFFYR